MRRISDLNSLTSGSVGNGEIKKIPRSSSRSHAPPVISTSTILITYNNAARGMHLIEILTDYRSGARSIYRQGCTESASQRCAQHGSNHPPILPPQIFEALPALARNFDGALLPSTLLLPSIPRRRVDVLSKKRSLLSLYTRARAETFHPTSVSSIFSSISRLSSSSSHLRARGVSFTRTSERAAPSPLHCAFVSSRFFLDPGGLEVVFCVLKCRPRARWTIRIACVFVSKREREREVSVEEEGCFSYGPHTCSHGLFGK